MVWSEQYDSVHKPTDENISTFVRNDLWQELNSYLQETFHALPKMMYSGCSMQRGWNVKYQKRNKSLCTLYPMSGYFIALVVIGIHEINEAEFLMPLCSEYTQNLFKQTSSGYSGKWIMIDVKSKDILEDVKKMIALRANNR